MQYYMEKLSFGKKKFVERGGGSSLHQKVTKRNQPWVSTVEAKRGGGCR